MILSIFNKRYIKPIPIIAMLIMLVGVATGCEYLGITSEEETGVETTHTDVKTSDRAILVVYEHLLHQAEGDKAKVYLSNFYTVCDKWNAWLEVLKDDTSIWHVVVDMTDVETWEERAYWQQASWFVFKDGKVTPSNRFRANALRVEADLQALSPKAESQAE